MCHLANCPKRVVVRQSYLYNRYNNKSIMCNSEIDFVNSDLLYDGRNLILHNNDVSKALTEFLNNETDSHILDGSDGSSFEIRSKAIIDVDEEEVNDEMAIDVTLYLTNRGWCDCYEGVAIGRMKVYRTHWYYNQNWWWADAKSALLGIAYKAKLDICDDDHKDFDDDAWGGSEHYIIDDFRLRRDLVGKGFGYEALYQGLMSAGAKNGFIYLLAGGIVPTEEEKEQGYEQISDERLEKFYLGMEQGTYIHTFDCDDEHFDGEKVIICKNWNCNNTARRSEFAKVYATC